MDDEIDTALDVDDVGAPVGPTVATSASGAWPARIGRYHVLAPVGRGGMAEVFLAELRGPLGFRRPVAIKRLYPALAHDPDTVARFVREATIATRLVHPGICQVYELDEDDDGCFIVMEYLDGITLAATLKELARARWLLPLPVVLRVVRSLASALHAAHELRDGDGTPLGLVHRDVTPSNVVLTVAGQVKLLDFGVAKTDHVRTQIGVVRGKPGYMSPEQLARLPLDRRSDVYSLGIVLYETLTSARLFARARVAEPALTPDGDVVPDPRGCRPDLPMAVVAVLDRALARSPGDRYPTAAALAAALTTAMSPARPAPASWLARLVASIRARQVQTPSSWTAATSLTGPGPGPRRAAELSTPTPVGTPS